MRRMTRLLCLMLLFSLITFSCPLAEETDAPTGTPAPTPMLTAVPESALAPFNVVLPEDAHVEMAEGRITLVRGDSRVVAMVISRVPDEDPAAALPILMQDFDPKTSETMDFDAQPGFCILGGVVNDAFCDGEDKITLMVLADSGELLNLRTAGARSGTVNRLFRAIRQPDGERFGRQNTPLRSVAGNRDPESGGIDGKFRGRRLQREDVSVPFTRNKVVGIDLLRRRDRVQEPGRNGSGRQNRSGKQYRAAQCRCEFHDGTISVEFGFTAVPAGPGGRWTPARRRPFPGTGSKRERRPRPPDKTPPSRYRFRRGRAV